MKTKIVAANAPKAIGPYSQGVSLCRLLFTSGQIPAEPATGKIPADIESQTELSLKNVKAVVEAGGSSMENVLKVTVYLKDMKDFAAVNEVYGKFFKEPYPARVCVEAAKLPKDVLIEIDAIAAMPG